MASKRDSDETLTVLFRNKHYAIPVHWRTDAEVKRRYGAECPPQGVTGFVNPITNHVWVSHEANRKKALDHELEHIFTEIRQRIWDGE